MKEKKLMKGNEAMAEAAIIAGCRYYFGYPITPQNEIPAYMSARLPKVNGVFIQSESEIAAISMVFGAAAAGARVMTSSSSPGISLKQEGLSYLAGARLPCVVANIQRAGPGLGGIGPAQGDYFQATKGGGHGDYHLIVLAPYSVQEMADLTVEAFDLADVYRVPVMMLGDAIIGQMMEPVVLPESSSKKMSVKDWALVGAKGRPSNIIRSFFRREEDILKNNVVLQKTYKQISEELVKYEEFYTEDAEIILVAYGASARIAKSIVQDLRKTGIKIGILRPITLYPFPTAILSELADRVKGFYVIEMSYGQMVEDVKLSVNGKKPVYFYGISSGYLPYEFDIKKNIDKIMGGLK